MELKEYLKLFVMKKGLIITIVAVACILTGIKGFFFTEPQYRASTKLMVNIDSSSRMEAANVQTGIMLINSYIDIIHTSVILDKVVEENPELNISPSQLSHMLLISSGNGSQVMDIAAIGGSYEQVANIVNAVAEVFKREIPSLMGVNNVTILTKADANSSPGPINASPLTSIIVMFFVSTILAIGLVILIDYFDDRVKTEEDVEKYIALPVLTVIPSFGKTKERMRSTLKTEQKVGENTYVSAK